MYTAADLWTVTEAEEADVKSKQTGILSLEIDEEYVDTIEQEPVATTVVQDSLTEDTIAMLSPKAPITIDASASLEKAIRQMNSHNIGCLLVTDNADKLIGIFTERDVLMRVTGLVDNMAAAKVADYMTGDPIALSSNLPIAQAVHEMSVHGFRHLPLVDAEHRPEGIVSFRDVIRHLKENLN